MSIELTQFVYITSDSFPGILVTLLTLAACIALLSNEGVTWTIKRCAFWAAAFAVASACVAFATPDTSGRMPSGYTATAFPIGLAYYAMFHTFARNLVPSLEWLPKLPLGDFAAIAFMTTASASWLVAIRGATEEMPAVIGGSGWIDGLVVVPLVCAIAVITAAVIENDHAEQKRKVKCLGA